MHNTSEPVPIQAGAGGTCQVSGHTGMAGAIDHGDHPRPRLGRLQQRTHLYPAFLTQPALVSEGDGVVEAGPGAEVVA